MYDAPTVRNECGGVMPMRDFLRLSPAERQEFSQGELCDEQYINFLLDSAAEQEPTFSEFEEEK